LAGISLLVGLKTVPGRRALDPKQPLGYLPGDCQIVGAVQVNKALDEPAGRDLLSQFPIGPVELGATNLEKWTGLSREQINAVALGLKVDRLPPRLFVVIQTAMPYDEAQLRSTLKDAKEVTRGERTLYRFALNKGFSGTVWYAAKSILILTLAPEDMDQVPAEPLPGVDHFASPLAEFLKDKLRIGPQPQAWLAGYAENWNKTLAGPALARLAPGNTSLLSDFREWGFWVTLGQDVALNAACHFQDEAAAQSFADTLNRKQGEAAAPARIEPGAWVSWQRRTTAEAIRQALGGESSEWTIEKRESNRKEAGK
jgi:hypothetical protein